MASFTVLALMDLVRGAGPPPSPLSSPNRYVALAIDRLVAHVSPETETTTGGSGRSSSGNSKTWDLFAWLQEAGGSAESTVCGRVFKDVSAKFNYLSFLPSSILLPSW